MSFADWIRNSIIDVRQNGISGVKKALIELRYGVRDRCRNFHWLTTNTRELTVGDISIKIQQKHVGEFDHIRAHHNEYWLADDLLKTLEKSDSFWDVGGNIGIYTLIAAERGADVVTFEPWLENAATIERNLNKNDLSARVIPKALADKCEPRDFILDERETPGSGRGSLLNDWQDGRTKTVECVRGDVAIQRDGVRSPSVIKIDVEGAELEVIRGLGDFLGDVRVIYCELHGINDDEVRKFIQEAGFEIVADLDETECGVLKARNNS